MTDKSKIICVSTFLLLLGFAVVFNSNMNLNTVPDIKRNIVRIIPEGWSLFTRKSLRESYVLYQIEEGGALKKITIKNSSPENLFGVSRKARKLDMERQWIGNPLPDSVWTKHINNERFIKNPKLIYVKKLSNNTWLGSGFYLLLKITRQDQEARSSGKSVERYESVKINYK